MTASLIGSSMIPLTRTIEPRTVSIRVLTGQELRTRMPKLTAFATRSPIMPLSQHPGWLNVFNHSFGHEPFVIEAIENRKTCGILPLAGIRSWLFGRFLVGLPYLNTGGVQADHPIIASQLVDSAVSLCESINARYLELRHSEPLDHGQLTNGVTNKVHMRLDLPGSPGQLWDELDPKVRNQVRKGQKNQLAVSWGKHDLIEPFYQVFARNMRDLGTPVYSQRLFEQTLNEFPDRAEICVVYHGRTPIAGAVLLHGWGITEVPSASSLRSYNSTCANMLMYWHLLERAILRGQEVFDFGRCSPDASTFRFKKQWGAQPQPIHWQYYVRRGTISDMRPENPRFRRAIQLWRRLPLRLTRWLGPAIVRGIP